ncbi:hypothetical protein AL035_20740 [Salipiger aestuarii]|uniref:Uncharacterized protein n=1 Tax=Salipiger aestuarii TaxID=568098 RepID=A0A327XHG4_9RHOB|nr:hypothetical protein C357_14401 [Citreicella sp. 357]KAB2533447.1 hypothetical protein AL035_20740 [Salipiger aestuarii]RAK08220.1 hypothetical protein ATI53_10837 [Salipiger aestuarii]
MLAFAADFDAVCIGAVAGITVGSGAAASGLLLAGPGVAARSPDKPGAGDGHGVQALLAAVHVMGGVLIAILSIGMLLPMPAMIGTFRVINVMS